MDQDSTNLEDNFIFLTDIIQSKAKFRRTIRKKEEDIDINSTPIIEGDICVALNKYKGL